MKSEVKLKSLSCALGILFCGFSAYPARIIRFDQSEAPYFQGYVLEGRRLAVRVVWPKKARALREQASSKPLSVEDPQSTIRLPGGSL
jgi:hypothetical protein